MTNHDLLKELRSLLEQHTFAVPQRDEANWGRLREGLSMLYVQEMTRERELEILRLGYLLTMNADLRRDQVEVFHQWGQKAFEKLLPETFRGQSPVKPAEPVFECDETYEEAKFSSLLIRSPDDVRPVRWRCNPDKRWVHLTESEWIGLHDAFDDQARKYQALADSVSRVLVSMEWVLEQKNVSPADVESWLKELENGQKGVWPPEGEE